MESFSLRISQVILSNKSSEPFDFCITPEHNWFIHGSSDGNIFSLFDWLEDKKYFKNGILEYRDCNNLIQGHYAVKKYFEILRFRISENESSSFYYQQRYHATENDSVITLREYLGEVKEPYFNRLIDEFGLKNLMVEAINMLSSGEFRKATIVKVSMLKPRVMFIEEPYIGLDKEGIDKIDSLLAHLASEYTTIVIASTGKHIPHFITDVLHLHQGNVIFSGNKQLYKVPAEQTAKKKSFKIPQSTCNNFTNAFELRNLTLKYGERIILKDINWKVAKGEKWLLSGQNGTGKSMLLSLLYADNPQVYSNEVYLFDTKRGSGESIWEIKDKISFYSTEMYRFFNKSLSIDESVRYLVFQNPYNKREFLKKELEFKEFLMDYFGFVKDSHLALFDLPAVHQKLVLIMAGLLKNAPFLILDEPFQGFDEKLIQKTLLLIDEYAKTRTFVMVTHNPDEIPVCIQKRFHLDGGEGTEVVLSGQGR
jgi:molybdate transport system ATP-binding protein